MTTVEARELLDVGVRLRDMDSLNVYAHVMYPTLLLVQPTTKPEIDVALKRAYNRWLGDRYEQSEGRLRWLCVPPLMNMDETINEMRWAKDHGAVGVFKKGNREADKGLTDEYFGPLWKEANDLEMPVCIHIGSGIPNTRENRTENDARGPLCAVRLAAGRVHHVGHAQDAPQVPQHPVGIHRGGLRLGPTRAASDQAPGTITQARGARPRRSSAQRTSRMASTRCTIRCGNGTSS